LPFFREIIRDEEFIAGRLDTGFIARFNERRERAHPAAAQASSLQSDIAIIAAALAYTRGLTRPSTERSPLVQSKWKNAGRIAGLNRGPKRELFERR
jgi:hypothetical protein